MSATASLLEVFSRLDDPRSARGIRHPFAGIVSLTLLGMLARIREMEVLVRWATVNWDTLRTPLGLTVKHHLVRRPLVALWPAVTWKTFRQL